MTAPFTFAAHRQCLPGLPLLDRGWGTEGLGYSLATPLWGASVAVWSGLSTPSETHTPASENLSGYRRFCGSESNQRKGRCLPRVLTVMPAQ